jgi:hypothetical protein
MKRRVQFTPLESGQVWQLPDSNLQIQLVGKRLVHYKHFKGKNLRAPISLSGKEALEKYLKANKGILVQE